MEKEFSPIECQKIMNELARSHDEANLTMYQNYKYKHILIVELTSIASYEIKALAAMNISASIFASEYRVEVWMQKC